MLIMYTMFMITLSMFYKKNPMVNIISLVFLTLLLSFYFLSNLKFSWFPMIIFLMMIGGLLILFLYMASLTPNKKLPKLKIIHFLFLLPIPLMSFMKLYLNPSIPMMIFSFPYNYPLMIFSISYLFILLFSVSLILQKMSGPLRST